MASQVIAMFFVFIYSSGQGFSPCTEGVCFRSESASMFSV
jgi:hypothetical protein